LIAVALLGGAVVSGARADDWEIERSGPKSGQRPRERKPASLAPAKPTAARGAEPVPEARQLKLALERPYDDGVFERVVAAYRSRDGNLDGLLRELSAGDDGRAVEPLALSGRVHESLGNVAAARAAFDAAIARATKPVTRLQVLAARLERRDGALDRARELLRSGLAAPVQPEDRREALELLAEVELDRHDYPAAEAAFTELARAEQGSVFALTAFARALAARGEHARAAEAYRAALPKLSGDARAVAPALLEQATSELEAGEHARALETLARAQRLAAGAAGLRNAVAELRLSAHRRAGTLRALGDELSAQAPRSFEDAALLARVLEELGDVEQAQQALRRALAFKPKDAPTRLRLVRSLTSQGRLEEAIREHERLVESAPGEPAYVTGLAQTLLDSGQRAQALQLLQRTAQRFAGDARIARALLDVYARWGETERAREMVERLARIEPGDPSHMITLGQELLQRGDEAGSRAAFARALERASDRAAAHAALGEIYLDHDQGDRALEHFTHAVRLERDDARYARGLAEAFERVRRFADAEAAWRRVMELAGGDRASRREARRRIVLLWSNSGELRGKLRELELAFGLSPSDGGAPRVAPKSPVAPDLEAGRFLAEGYRMLAAAGRRARADATLSRATEQVLVRLLELAPGDIDALIALERLRAARGDLRGASAVLEKLLEADPISATTYLSQLAHYAQLDYRDAEALGYAERLAALAPDDPAAHRRLAELYRARQDAPRAAASLARALELDPSAHETALELAELWLAAGEGKRAEALLRRALAGSADDELVRRAARALIQVHLGAGTLATLESDFLSLALRGDRRVYLDLLIELYASLCRPLLVASARGSGESAAAARESLRAIGRRALKPLLEALSSGDAMTRNLAIEVLGASESQAALLPLLAMVERDGDLGQRRRALLALGPVANDSVIDRLTALAQADESRLRDAAAWAIARVALTRRSAKAERAALALTHSDTPPVRGFALLALANLRSKEVAERAGAVLEHDRSPWARGAAALALGHVGARDHAQALIAALTVESDEVSAAAALAIGMLGPRDASRALAARLVSGDPWSSRASAWALAQLATPVPRATLDLAAPSDRAALAPVLAAHLDSAPVARGALRAAAFDPLVVALRTALAGPLPTARAALRMLAQGSHDLAGWDDRLTGDLALAVAPSLAALTVHRDAEARAVAFELLLPLGPQRAFPVLAAALAHDDAAVRSDALDALDGAPSGAFEAVAGDRPTAPRGQAVPEAFARALIALSHGDPQWTVRQRATQALGRLWARTPSQNLLGQALTQALAADDSAYVREAAATAFASARTQADIPSASRAALERAAASDPETRVRNAATLALSLPFR
jgi:tetratricopeptide (TPR) repeat protein